MTITPFGRVEVQVQDLPQAKLQARQPASRRSQKDRFPDPKPQEAPRPTRQEQPQTPVDSTGQDEGLQKGHAKESQAPKLAASAAKGDLSREESGDGSEGALAFRPQDEVTFTGLAGAPAQGARRRAVQDQQALVVPVAIPQAGEGQAQAGPVQSASSNQLSAVAGAARTSSAKPLNATQMLLQRQQSQSDKKVETLESTRRQSPIQLSQEDRQSILETVSFALRDGKGEAILLLNPKELGSLSIQLSMEGKQLSLRLSAERPEVAEALLHDAEKLRGLLREQGLNIQDFDVRTGPQSEHRQEALDFRRNRGISSTGRAANGTVDAETEPTPTRPKSVRIDGTGIDFIA